ncbi:MAG: hypothetical protein AMXMBFR55_32840 [Gemmatimonadota bacterium]
MDRRIALAVLACAAAAPGAGAQTRLLRQPTISATQVAFAYANNLWVAPRDGGDARRLTSFQGVTTNPRFSPDGKWIAFSGQYAGNTDVYVVPAEGGEPRRLTWHPGADVTQGWTPDGSRIVFASARSSPNGQMKFWSVAPQGDVEVALSMPRAFQGTLSPDGKRVAYRMNGSWDDERRNYRGGQNRPIWIMDLATHEVQSPPWTDSKDIAPAWIGDVVYFLSDRDGVHNVWSYDTRSRALEQLTKFTDFDVKALDAGGGMVVFEQAGYLHTLDPRTRQHRRLDITVRGDFPWLVPQWKDVGSRITNIALSPTGKRAAVEARGEIFTIPAEKGDWRNLTRAAGSAERTPAWSPDGRQLAYFLRRRRRVQTDDCSTGRDHAPPRDRAPGAVVLLHAGLVARRVEDPVHRRAPAPVGDRHRVRAIDEGRHRSLHAARSVDRPGVEPRFALDRLRPPPAVVLPRHLRPRRAGRDDPAALRRNGRRHVARLGREREVPLLDGLDGLRSAHGVAGHVVVRPSGDARDLRGGAAEGRAVAAGSRE